jgi:hypothetical protein
MRRGPLHPGRPSNGVLAWLPSAGSRRTVTTRSQGVLVTERDITGRSSKVTATARWAGAGLAHASSASASRNGGRRGMAGT